MSLKLFDLTGRCALVTGGSKGLGKSMARGFAEAGADVVVSSRSEDELKAAVAEIQAKTGGKTKVDYIVADMTKREDVTRLADAAIQKLGKVDIVVNNAGSNQPQEIDKITDESWDRIVELNLSSCMALTRALVPGMKERKWGRIIHISSIMGYVSAAGRDAYSATKSALLGLARAGANDLGPHGITVNCIAPGPFLTDLPTSLLSKEQQDFFASRTTMGRWGEPDELIGPALLLASDAGGYITGASIVVDGGTLAKVF